MAYLVVLSFNLTPWVRGPQEWRWAYAIPATLNRLWLPALLLTIYLTAAYFLLRRTPSPATTVLVILMAAIMTPALQFALLYMDHPDIKAPLFYRTVSESAGGYFNVGATVTDISDFFRHFVERMPTYPVHPQRHPPGLPWLFALARQIFDQLPELARQLNASLRPYQCDNLNLMNLSNSAIASSVVQMSVPMLLGLVVWPLYALGRRVYDESTARRAALMWSLIPSIALWATRWDQLFALFTVGAFVALCYGLTRQRLRGLYLSGLIVSAALFFNFGNIVVVLLLALYAIFWVVGTQRRPPFSWLIWAVVCWSIGAATIWIVLYILYQFNPLAAWSTAMGIHLGLDRSYVTWLFFHPYDFFVFLGIPLAVLWFARTIVALRDVRPRRVPIDPLALTFLVGLILLILSGTSRGEVARVWAFLLPLPLLIAMYRFPERAALFTGMLGLVALQVFVSNIFLRTVGTGLNDPPTPPPQATLESMPLARWSDGMILQASDFARTVSGRDAIDLALTWSTSQPIDRPYTLFIHLLDAQGRLVAQYDGMPLANTWPTTCWQTNEGFTDHYRLTLPAAITPSDYQLRLGFYWLPNGERAPIEGEKSNADHSLDLGAITIQ